MLFGLKKSYLVVISLVLCATVVTCNGGFLCKEKYNETVEQILESSLASRHDDLQSLNLKQFLGNKMYSDAQIRAGDATIYASKIVLAARSQVFREEIATKKATIFDVPSLDRRGLAIFAGYLYSGEIPDIPQEVLNGLYAAAGVYKLPGLKKACVDQLKKNLKEENFISVLHLAHIHNDNELIAVVISFIVERKSLLMSEAWLKFAEGSPALAVHIYQQAMLKGNGLDKV